VTDQPSVRPAALSLRLSAFYFAHFVLFGIALPYWPVWLQSRGMGPIEIAVILSTGRWASVFTTPVVAMLADRRGESKILLIVLTSGVLAAYAANHLAHGFGTLLAIAVCTAIFLSPVMPVAESLTMLHAVRGQVDYGRVRLWGSISFMLATFAGGALLEGWSTDIILWAIMASTAVTVVVSACLPDTRSELVARRRGAFGQLARNPVLLLFIVAVAFLASSHAALYAFGTIYWRQAGLGDGFIGTLWAEGVVAEILLFALGGAFMRRIRPADAMLLAAAGGILRWTVLAVSTEPAALIAVQWLHALTFGAAHLGGMAFIVQAAPVGFSATVQSLYATLGMGAASALAILMVGPLYARYGGPGAYHAMAALSLAGGIAALLLRRFWDGRRIELRAGETAISAS
jgi:MFS transporter, PPP family, 3-phenylpropionic acid transporter